ncbi:unnamed protein product [Tuber aestivum]|uniref:Uncharacterized protein n=1 Tax=Tuber aestivum TaxID=59557 RepID=A0A292PJA1_9PEZI|nr:unnamed protein product [Tuber aestivum]
MRVISTSIGRGEARGKPDASVIIISSYCTDGRMGGRDYSLGTVRPVRCSIGSTHFVRQKGQGQRGGGRGEEKTTVVRSFQIRHIDIIPLFSVVGTATRARSLASLRAEHP